MGMWDGVMSMDCDEMGIAESSVPISGIQWVTKVVKVLVE